MRVELVTVADFFAHPDAPGVLAGYAEECADRDLPPINPHRGMYEAMQQAGVLHVFAALEGQRMLGALFLLVNLNPHYSVVLAVTESWFVLPEHRGSGAGLALYRAAKARARELGALSLYVSAPVGGQLAEVMSKRARETNRVFCEVL